jgi:hypothetical protein
MVSRPHEHGSIQHLKRSVGAFAVLALAACGAPFQAAPDCGAADPSCASSSDEITGFGGAAAEGGGTASAGGAQDEGGAPSGVGAVDAGGEAASIVGVGGEPARPPRSCRDALTRDPRLPSGLVTIDPDGSGPLGAFDARCDMTSDDGGWTQIGVGEYWQ